MVLLYKTYPKKQVSINDNLPKKLICKEKD
jgi:hypothetical protein